MNKKQNNRIEMYNAVQTYMDANASVWSEVPVINEMKTEFDALVAKINEEKTALNNAKIALGKAKKAQKKLVAEKATILMQTLVTYANDSNNAELAQKANTNYSKLFYGRNEDFNTKIGNALALLDQHKELLTPYGITEIMITDIENNFNLYKELKGRPRQLTIATSKAAKSLQVLFKNTSTLLSNRLDNVMLIFKQSNTNFYNGYSSARVIVDK